MPYIHVPRDLSYTRMNRTAPEPRMKPLFCALVQNSLTKKINIFIMGPVVRKEVSSNPGLKVKLGFDFFCMKPSVY